MTKNKDKKKTIDFEDIKQLKESKKNKDVKRYLLPNTSHKIIPYNRIKKKCKNKKKSRIVYNKFKPIIIAICAVLFFAIASSLFSDKPSKNKNSTFTNNFTSVSPNVSKNDFNYYENIISTSLENTLKLSSQSRVVTGSMHKNGNKIFAVGYFYLADKEPIYFDIILNEQVPISITVNGIEYIK